MKPTVEDLMAVKAIHTHAFCPDGTASAMICVAAFAAVGRSPDVKMVMYQTVDHDAAPAEPNQLWTDITPPEKRWRDWEGVRPIVLDHHESVQSVVEGLGGVYGGLDDSGASLAFTNVMRVLCRDREDIETWAKFAHLAMVRDTWKEASEDWMEALAVGAAIGFYTPKALFVSASEGKIDLHEITRFGRVLVKRAFDKSAMLAKSTIFRTAGGLKYGVFNCTEKLMSETGHELIVNHGCDVAAGFFYTQEGDSTSVCVSLRSRKQGVPVNRIAEKFGGGGHQPAAGFRIKNAGDMGPLGLAKVIMEAAEEVLARDVVEEPAGG